MAFRDAIELALKHEGYYSNDPVDRGGPTKFGITLATLSIYRKAPVTEAMVKALTLEDALKVYEALYWSPMGLGEVNDERLSSIILDQAINRGVVTVTRKLQRLLNVGVDGIMGPRTIAALNSVDPFSFGLKFIFDAQMSYIEICYRDQTQLKFLKGWISRTQELLTVLLGPSGPAAA